MGQEYVEVLKLIVACLQSEDAETQERIAEQIKRKLTCFKEEGKTEQFVQFLQREYGEEPLIHMELLQYLVDITGDANIVCELLHSMLLDAVKQNEDYFDILNLSNQYVSRMFFAGNRLDIAENWGITSYLMSGMQELLGANYERIPVEERNQELIIISTKQLLGYRHAPTRITLEFCRLIETYLHKKVLLINEVQETDAEGLVKRGLASDWVAVTNYMEDATGRFQYEYNGYVLDGYQILVKRDTIPEMKWLIEELYKLKPACVWSLGGTPVLAGVMRQFTTYMYMAFTQGYPGIPADVIVNYFEASPIANADERDFLIGHDVRVKDIKYLFRYPAATGKVTREDYSIPKDAFCMVLVGNRLAHDCTEEFLDVIRRAIENGTEKERYILFIGETNETFENTVKERIGCPAQIRFLGYQPNLEDAIAIADIFVNPPCLGGGTGGVLALNEGKPVVTLNRGDVASFAGKGFVCEDLEEYLQLIERYATDTAFYQAQSEHAKKRVEEMVTDDEELAKILQGVIEMAM